MKVRQATEDDTGRIKEIAEDSFRASYALSPLDIEAVVEIEFEHDPLTSRLDEDGRLILVAEEGDDVLGFSEGHVSDDAGEITWLHVDPTERGNGAGTKLFERMLADLRERAVTDVQATVLAENQEGGEFFQQFAFESTEKTDREFDERTLHVEVYRDEGAGDEANGTDSEAHPGDEEYTLPEDEEITVEGETRYLDPHDALSGDEAEILPVFETEGRSELLGYYCTNCGTFTDSVDGQGKVVCESCGNEHRPEEWDESYL